MQPNPKLVEENVEYFDPYFAFARSSIQFGRRLAVVHSSALYTYTELRKRVDAIAEVLSENEVKQGDVIALALVHNIDLVAAPLAVLKLGATYLPIDTRIPKARLNYILEDAQPILILSNDQTSSWKLPLGCKRLHVGKISTTHEKPSSTLSQIQSTRHGYLVKISTNNIWSEG